MCSEGGLAFRGLSGDVTAFLEVLAPGVEGVCGLLETACGEPPHIGTGAGCCVASADGRRHSGKPDKGGPGALLLARKNGGGPGAGSVDVGDTGA